MLRRVFGASAALASLGGVASGQIAVTAVGGPPFVEAWVDPCNGNDANALLDFPPCQAAPFRTIQAAINRLAGGGPGSPGLVHCGPGIYASSTNGEDFPILMRNNVHLQGVGARQCVIRGEGLDPTPRLDVFFPTDNGNCTCGTAGNAVEVLVDLSLLHDASEEMIDGITFQGGDVQVYFEGEQECYARISNCVFDMLCGDETVLKYDGMGGVAPNPLAGPLFGMLIVHQYHPIAPYYATPINVLNNTFIMAWLPSDDAHPVLSRPDAVAICDVNDPLCGLPPGQSDPNPGLRGIGPLNIQNNLIRTAPRQIATAMLGIDDNSVTAVIGTPLGASNAFDPSLVGGRSATGAFCSKFNLAGPGSNGFGGNGMPPTARINIDPTAGGRDAGFVGEMLSRALGEPLSVSRDWRLLPSSALVDAGTMPSPLAAGGVLLAANGTAYFEPGLVPLSSFDLDGEVYGNPRVQPVFGSSLLLADIGFDEAHLMVSAAWANDSVSHLWIPGLIPPLICGPLNQGQPYRHVIFPVAGPFVLFNTRVPVVLATLGLIPCTTALPTFSAFTTMWVTVVPPVVIPGFAPFHDLLWMDFSFVTVDASGTAAPVVYFAPNDPTPLSFATGVVPAHLALEYLNAQAQFSPAGTTIPFASNLQSLTD